MRVNVNTTPNGWKYKAYLDGVFVQYCVEADDEAGYVIAARTDANGKIVFDAAMPGETRKPIMERRAGVVRIEPPEATP